MPEIIVRNVSNLIKKLTGVSNLLSLSKLRPNDDVYSKNSKWKLEEKTPNVPETEIEKCNEKFSVKTP